MDLRLRIRCHGLPNPDIQIVDSYRITNRADQVGIFTLIRKYIVEKPSENVWSRTEPSMYIEWDVHNWAYKKIKIDNFKHADFDNNDAHLLLNLLKRMFHEWRKKVSR